jgi:hypothetical protein
MIRSELHDDRCYGCGASLDQAVYFQREHVVYTQGEFRGEPVAALCRCGSTSVVPFSVDLRRAA